MLDMMGHGLSQVRSSSDKIDKTADQIFQILELEGHTKAHLVGVSMGSLQAQYFAHQYPDLTASLTILGGYDINADNAEVNKAQRKENLKWIFKALFSMPSFRNYVSEVSCDDPTSRARMLAMAEGFTRRSFRVMSGLGEVIQKRDAPFRSYPMMIMVGDGDIELSQKMSANFHEREPLSRFVVLEGAGHCANMDQADRFNNELRSFLE
jgi:pimeloyl-ACP methyl ester carboxylesterase